MYPQFYMRHPAPKKIPKKIKLLDDSDDSYIVSYVSLTHKNHAFLCLSKKIDDQYYVINTAGVMESRNSALLRDDTANKDYRVIHELIRPSRDFTAVNAKHYYVSEETVDRVLDFIEHQRNTNVSFNEFSKNCHNFAVAILDNIGIYDSKLNSSIFPHDSSCFQCEMTRVDVPPEILSSSMVGKFQFYDANGKTYGNTEDIQETLPTTWVWGNIIVQDKLVYRPEEKYYAIIKCTPNLSDEEESNGFKKALYLLQDYSNGSRLFHPCRNYRDLVKNTVAKYQDEEGSISELLNELRQLILEFHEENGDVPNAKGSLLCRLAFIDFVLNSDISVNSFISTHIR